MSDDENEPEEFESEEFSSTMRIDIPPDLLKSAQQGTTPTETRKKRRKTIRVSPQGSDSVSVSKFDQLLQSIYDAAIITDLEGNILDANHRAVEFLVYSRDELKNLTILDVVSGAGADMLRSIRNSLENDRFVLIEAFCRRKDESLFPSEISVNQLKMEDASLCFFIRDTTIRKAAEEMIKASHNAIKNAGNGIAIADLEGKLTFVNPALLRIHRSEDEKDLLSQDVWGLFKDDETVEAMMKAIFGGDERWHGELEINRKDGTAVTVYVSTAANMDADGEFVGLVMSFADLTDRKRAEDAVVQAETHRAMLATLGTACHHLGQPATVLITNIKMMERMMDDLDEGLKDMIRMNSEAADTLQEILEKLNAVTVFVTTEYLNESDNPESAENQLLEL